MENVIESDREITSPKDKNGVLIGVGDVVAETTGTDCGGRVEMVSRRGVYYRDIDGDLNCSDCEYLVVIARAGEVSTFKHDATTTDHFGNAIRIGSVVSDQGQVGIGTVLAVVPGFILYRITDEGCDVGKRGDYSMANANDVMVVGYDPDLKLAAMCPKAVQS